MSDIKIRTVGQDEASGALKSTASAVRDTGRALDQASKSAESNANSIALLNNAYGIAVDGVKKAAGAIVDFAKESMAAYKDSERISAQLRLVAGSMTDAFKAQAGAMQEAFGVDDDMVVKMQTMLLRFGEAPEKIESTVKALLDYSAATGNDAVSATNELMSSVESGRTAFKELGLQYETTGQASKDMEAVTRSLLGVVGGAADVEAHTLVGSANKAARAVDDLKKSFGALIVEVEQKLGVMESVSDAMSEMAKNVRATLNIGKALSDSVLHQYVGGASPRQINEGFGNTLMSVAAGFASNPESLYSGGGDGGVGGIGPNGKGDRTTAAGRRLAEAGNKHSEEYLRRVSEGGRDQTPASALDPRTGLPMTGGKSWYVNPKTVEEMQKEAEEEAEKFKKAQESFWAVVNDAASKRDAEIEKERTDRLNEAMKISVDDVSKQEKQWAEAGERIAGAFVDEFSSVMSELMSGGEVDMGEMMLGLADTVLSVIGAAIGTIAGGAIGAQVGGSVGHLAGTGLRAAFGRRKHDGGAIERFHSGGWPGGLSPDEVPIIAQEGEHVLSRRDVANMGGQSGVEAAKRGGATVYISTMDGTTMRETFERQGGRAIFNALRAGRGSLVPLFGGA